MNRQTRYEYHLMCCIGMVVYALCEIAFRGYTHFSMVLTGGLCAALIHAENRKLKNAFLPLKWFCGCITVTSVEYAVGILVNRTLQWNVWDYSDRFLQVNGQICLLFSFFWFLLSIPCFWCSDHVAHFCSCYFPSESY